MSIDTSDEYRNCAHCSYWIRSAQPPVFAVHANIRAEVGQCANDANDAAPLASMVTGAVFVFTPKNACCLAFELHSEHRADLLADRAHYTSLLRERWTG